MNQFIPELTDRVRSLLAEKEHIAIAIDGNCTAGKSTLAAALEQQLPCRVIHMDDFFLQPHQRTAQRFATPGGNIDHERFADEVIPGLISGNAITFSPFDCGTRTLCAPVTLEVSPITLVEGTYCLHPSLEYAYDLKIFLSISPETQRQRIAQRPAFLHRRFFEEWIPMEQLYFDTFGIPGKCQMIFHTP